AGRRPPPAGRRPPTAGHHPRRPATATQPERSLVRAYPRGRTEERGRTVNLLAGEVAIVTGSGSGVGRGVCLPLARAGARVAGPAWRCPVVRWPSAKRS